jgi:signal transduction histidine kinase
VLINLLNNAAKFTDNGEIILSIKVSSVNSNQTSVMFTVKDSGIGMTQEQVTKLFTAFVQADTSISRTYGGTGLGLTICKQLVALMGGGYIGI